MGCFSWLDCYNHYPIYIGKTAHLLVPEEFQAKYGPVISTYSYDGYGTFGDYDVYDLLAEWNRGSISTDFIETLEKNQFCGLWNFTIEDLRNQGYSEDEILKKDDEKRTEYYQQALAERNNLIDSIIDFNSGKLSDKKMELKYGRDWKREIGIALQHDLNPDTIKYPLKISYSPSFKYEDMPASPTDPGQGRERDWGENALDEEYD